MIHFRMRRELLVAVAIVAVFTSGVSAAADQFDAENAQRLGGFTHRNMSATSIAPQGVFVSGGATEIALGVQLAPASSSRMAFSVVVPPDVDGRLSVRIVYIVNSPDACAWVITTSGSAGPDGPNSVANIHNYAWRLPGTTATTGPIQVPAGAGYVHKAILRSSATPEPGMFLQFDLSRLGDDAADTCSFLTIAGLELLH
jgi:hypothetical protein